MMRHGYGAAVRIAGAALWSILLVCGASAQVAVERQEVSGRGSGEQEAVRNALQEAALQLCGVRLRSETSSKLTYAASDDEVEIIEGINQEISLGTGKDDCRLASYAVLAVTEDGDDVRVRVQVEYSTYRVPGPDVERRRLAVLDFAMDEVHLYGAGGGREQQSDGRVVRRGVAVDFDLIRNLQDRFRARIEELLTQGRRFAVLDRSAPEVYEQERAILHSPDVEPAEAARLGKVLGADYLLYGTVDRIAVEAQRTEIQLTGERHERQLGTMRVRFTVLAVATRQVKWSSSMVLERVAAEELRPEQVAEALLDEGAAYLADELTENIYPPVVTQVTDPWRFVVNRGGNTIRAGDLFEVFALHDTLVDPDTGESLGRLETSVGVARITAVKAKYSLAEMIRPAAGVTRGMVLRRYRGSIQEAEALPARDTQDTADGTRNIRNADGDHDGLPDYLNRDAQTSDRDGDGLPDYLNRDALRRRQASRALSAPSRRKRPRPARITGRPSQPRPGDRRRCSWAVRSP